MTKSKKTTSINTAPTVLKNNAAIHAEIVGLLEAPRTNVARNINNLMTAAYWEIGRRTVEDEQKGEARAEYGEQLIERLAADLSRQFGRGFGARNLAQMRSFYLAWREGKILQTVSAKSPKPLGNQ